jgi:hypothetical protein
MLFTFQVAICTPEGYFNEAQPAEPVSTFCGTVAQGLSLRKITLTIDK